MVDGVGKGEVECFGGVMELVKGLAGWFGGDLGCARSWWPWQGVWVSVAGGSRSSEGRGLMGRRQGARLGLGQRYWAS